MSRWLTFSGFLLVASCAAITMADEGMFPISELERLKLSEKGMQLTPRQVFNSEEVSLVDGICRVNGCTGSFVSSQGLIITNHHCAFEAIQKGSTSEHDLLLDGFISKNQAEEIPAPGYTVRITERYSDVSTQVLEVVRDGMPFLERTKTIDKRRKELEQIAEKENPGYRAEVAEMFTGKTYVLFLYTYLKDVRLVFAPPIAVGNFGGEADNWEWPRHTGDFSFMRAYVAPDGSSATYAKENIPYQPKRFIPVSAQGANEEDFVFILGYPGRTVRHKTASFLRYERDVRLPLLVELNAWQIAEMDKASAFDRAVAIKHAARTKGLANVEKRSRGQLQGIRRANIVEAKSDAESALQRYIDADPVRKKQYGTLLSDIEKVYAEMSERGPLEIHLRELRTACRALSFAYTICDAVSERAKEDLDRETPYMDRNYPLTIQQLKLDVQDWHAPTDRILLEGMLERLVAIPGATEIPILRHFAEQGTSFEPDRIDRCKLGDWAFIEASLKKSFEELQSTDEVLLEVMLGLYPTYKQLRDLDKEREGKLNQLYGSLMEVKQAYQSTAFVPDANATLRITYGYVRGYSPQDAVIKTPISTLKGVIDKTTGIDPFITPDAVLKRYKAGEFGRFAHPKLHQVPVAILYNTDTTGGNSGSPVLNAKGQLVGVNFDRTFEATINDFAWHESYSRSIGVDIRYVLWITGVAYEAKHLLREMGVE